MLQLCRISMTATRTHAHGIVARMLVAFCLVLGFGVACADDEARYPLLRDSIDPELEKQFDEALTAEFPMVLLTGRGTSAQWHTNTRTGKSAVLRTLHPENAYVELHPEDARDLRIQPNATVRVVSPRGAVECVAFVTSSVQRGQVFMPMHYEVTNELTAPEVDPHSRQPSYKYAAVRVEALNEI